MVVDVKSETCPNPAEAVVWRQPVRLIFDLFDLQPTYNLHQLFSPFLLISSGHRLAQRLRVMHIRAPMIRGISVTLQADGINTQGFPKMDEGRHNGSSRYHCYENENKSI